MAAGCLFQLKSAAHPRRAWRRPGRQTAASISDSLSSSDQPSPSPDFDRQATLGGLLSALRGTNESMNFYDRATVREAALMSTDCRARLRDQVSSRADGLCARAF